MEGHSEGPRWSVLTNHGRVLGMISVDPDVRVREIADSLAITERSVMRIIAELEGTGHLSHRRVSNRNRYVINDRAEHPSASELDAEALSALVTLGRAQ